MIRQKARSGLEQIVVCPETQDRISSLDEMQQQELPTLVWRMVIVIATKGDVRAIQPANGIGHAWLRRRTIVKLRRNARLVFLELQT